MLDPVKGSTYVRESIVTDLIEMGMLSFKPIDTSMAPNSKLLPHQVELLDDPGQYHRLGSLLYVHSHEPMVAST